VTEPNEGHKVFVTIASVKIERNKLMSWERPVQGLNKPGGVTPSAKSSITIRTLVFIRKITKLFPESLAKLPFALFKLGYEIAKLVTRVLSSIRRLLFVAK
jgi:hypothetical protein